MQTGILTTNLKPFLVSSAQPWIKENSTPYSDLAALYLPRSGEHRIKMIIPGHTNCPILSRRKSRHERAKTETFFQFQRLPTEIRLMVWEIEARRRRLVGHNFCARDLLSLSTPHRTWNGPPTIAHVCRESRHVALQHGHIHTIPYRGLVRTNYRRMWFGNRDIALVQMWPALSTRLRSEARVVLLYHLPQLHDMVKYWCIEELLIPCDIHRGYWEEALYRVFQTLALTKNTIKVVNCKQA